MVEHNYGSNIKFEGKKKGKEKNIKYSWVANAKEKTPNIIYINKYDNYWLKMGDKKMTRELRRILSHEPIHCMLWDMDEYGKLDFIVNRFRHQIERECPKTYNDWMVF